MKICNLCDKFEIGICIDCTFREETSPASDSSDVSAFGMPSVLDSDQEQG